MNDLLQPSIKDVNERMCGNCDALVCAGCPVYEMDKLASLRARAGELERERDAAVSDLQDAVDFVYKVYGESNETLAAITTGHWRVVIASAKGAK